MHIFSAYEKYLPADAIYVLRLVNLASLADCVSGGC
jgi:hypothetical protein